MESERTGLKVNGRDQKWAHMLPNTTHPSQSSRSGQGASYLQRA
jgi:hypothetical protein